MNVWDKLETVGWFAARPMFWPHMAELARRRLSPTRDTAQDMVLATQWATERAQPVGAALAAVGLPSESLPIFPAALLEEGAERAAQSAATMGGPGDVHLLYAATRLLEARRVVETGVAYGWSSLALLAGMDGRPDARLVSVDMPYPKMQNEAFVGIVVPDRLRKQWTLVREPDRNGLAKALMFLGGTIDICHYDSDKSYAGREYAFPLLWRALRPGGLFISDDIQDNFGFRNFAAQTGAPSAVTESDGKHVGLLRKPG